MVPRGIPRVSGAQPHRDAYHPYWKSANDWLIITIWKHLWNASDKRLIQKINAAGLTEFLRLYVCKRPRRARFCWSGVSGSRGNGEGLSVTDGRLSTRWPRAVTNQDTSRHAAPPRRAWGRYRRANDPSRRVSGLVKLEPRQAGASSSRSLVKPEPHPAVTDNLWRAAIGLLYAPHQQAAPSRTGPHQE
jgi:hypothetical protein